MDLAARPRDARQQSRVPRQHCSQNTCRHSESIDRRRCARWSRLSRLDPNRLSLLSSRSRLARRSHRGAKGAVDIALALRASRTFPAAQSSTTKRCRDNRVPHRRSKSHNQLGNASAANDSNQSNHPRTAARLRLPGSLLSASSSSPAGRESRPHACRIDRTCATRACPRDRRIPKRPGLRRATRIRIL